ncbi:MAG: ribose 5-phosphate isomerase B [Dehalobacter sp. 4CP]|uniref:ribose 5-phosphate isomerase B n=1 Tax=Dehalobacter sp. CP TaxID=2594474 RepID=UPI0013CD5D31|nr:ribose 5-phosphate isomerase B [Dehalobacter sp.]NBJ15860.1 ribose 5-phosphate isomerase B [Dehalobacter sp. 4CP]
MKIALGADHAGYQLKECIKEFLAEKGHEILDCGTDSDSSVDYPGYGFNVGKAVIESKADSGIVVCGTGIGISIAANKVKGIRAALCTDSYMAKMARQHNNANILALGARVIGQGVALDIVETFLTTSFSGWKHARRVDMISDFEQRS